MLSLHGRSSGPVTSSPPCISGELVTLHANHTLDDWRVVDGVMGGCGEIWEEARDSGIGGAQNEKGNSIGQETCKRAAG